MTYVYLHSEVLFRKEFTLRRKSRTSITTQAMPLLSEKLIGYTYAILRVSQWLSAAIVMGISSYFISVGPRHQHALYWEILVSLTGSTRPSRILSSGVVGYIGCYILYRLCTILPSVSEHGKIYLGVLRGFCR
jgi:hypothetical protein